MSGGMVVPKGGMFLETYVRQDVFIRGDGLVLFRSSLVVLVFLPFVRMSPLVSVRMGSSCAGSNGGVCLPGSPEPGGACLACDSGGFFRRFGESAEGGIDDRRKGHGEVGYARSPEGCY